MHRAAKNNDITFCIAPLVVVDPDPATTAAQFVVEQEPAVQACKSPEMVAFGNEVAIWVLSAATTFPATAPVNLPSLATDEAFIWASTEISHLVQVPVHETVAARRLPVA